MHFKADVFCFLFLRCGGSGAFIAAPQQSKNTGSDGKLLSFLREGKDGTSDELFGKGMKKDCQVGRAASPLHCVWLRRVPLNRPVVCCTTVFSIFAFFQRVLGGATHVEEKGWKYEKLTATHDDDSLRKPRHGCLALYSSLTNCVRAPSVCFPLRRFTMPALPTYASCRDGGARKSGDRTHHASRHRECRGTETRIHTIKKKTERRKTLKEKRDTFASPAPSRGTSALGATGMPPTACAKINTHPPSSPQPQKGEKDKERRRRA
jgi:hypothetical protein